MKFVYSILFFLVLNNSSFSQNLESQIFELSCHSLIRVDRVAETRNQLKAITAVEDPITGEIRFDFPEKPWTKPVETFSRYSDEEKHFIFKTAELPVHPLTKTIFIVDSFQHFSERDFSAAGYEFKLRHNAKNVSRSSQSSSFFLRQIVFRENDVIVCFSFSGTEKIYCLTFLSENGFFKLIDAGLRSLPLQDNKQTETWLQERKNYPPASAR